jgi:hypothetical protein
MYNILIYVIEYIISVFIGTFEAIWFLLKLVVGNIAVVGPVLIVIVLALVLTLLTYTVTFFLAPLVAYFFYYFFKLFLLYINVLTFGVWNGIIELIAFLIPIVNTISEILVNFLLSLWEHVCGEFDSLGQCFKLDRIIFAIDDLLTFITTFIELTFLRITIYRDLIYEFVCRLSLFNAKWEQRFCMDSTNVFSRDYLISNQTTYYISQQFLEDLDTFASGIANTLKFLIGPVIDYGFTSLRFVGAIILVVYKWFIVGSIVILRIILSIIAGVLFSTASRASGQNLAELYNQTIETTFTQAFDLMAGDFTEAILEIDGYRFFVESDFPCPPGFCDTLANIINQTENGMMTMYQNVPNLFLFADNLLCTVQHLHSCGSEFGICTFLFGESGLVNRMVNDLFDEIADSLNDEGSFFLSFLKIGSWIVNALQSTTNWWADVFEDVCNTLLSIGECPCWVCQINKERQKFLYFVFSVGTKGGVVCNPFQRGPDICCLAQRGGGKYWTSNCVQKSGSTYTSIFYFLLEMVFFGNFAEYLKQRPFNCRKTVGYQYEFLNNEIGNYFDEYYEEEFLDVMLPILEEFNPILYGSFLLSNGKEPYEKFNSMYAQYFFKEWLWIDYVDVDPWYHVKYIPIIKNCYTV